MGAGGWFCQASSAQVAMSGVTRNLGAIPEDSTRNIEALSDNNTRNIMDDNPQLSLSMTISAQIPDSSPKNSTGNQSRTDSEKSLNSDTLEGHGVVLTSKSKRNTRTVSEEHLIHSNEWIEENVHSTPHVRC